MNAPDTTTRAAAIEQRAKRRFKGGQAIAPAPVVPPEFQAEPEDYGQADSLDDCLGAHDQGLKLTRLLTPDPLTSALDACDGELALNPTAAKRHKENEMNCTIDEDGYCFGFAPNDDDDAGTFGNNLQPGDEVTMDDGKPGIIRVITTRIHTGSPGQSNFVYVEIDKPDEEEEDDDE